MPADEYWRFKNRQFFRSGVSTMWPVPDRPEPVRNRQMLVESFGKGVNSGEFSFWLERGLDSIRLRLPVQAH